MHNVIPLKLKREGREDGLMVSALALQPIDGLTLLSRRPFWCGSTEGESEGAGL